MPVALRSFSPKSFLTYAAIGVAGTAFFFFLHHLGNQLPYELAEQRFETAFKEGNLAQVTFPKRRPGVPHPITGLSGYQRYDSCQAALMTLKAAQQQAQNAASLVDAVLWKIYERLPVRGASYCESLSAIVLGEAELGTNLEDPRYWWGIKALHAISLRWFSLFEIKEMTKTATYFAYLLLAVFLMRFYPRMLWFFLPLIIFGFFFSGIRYVSGASAAAGYLWAVLSAAGLVWLAGSRPPPRALHLFCFVVGMVSSYVWVLDHHTLFIMAFTGLFIYFASGKARFAVSCIALYVAGFLVCFTLGLLVKAAVFEWLVRDPVLWSRFYDGKIIYESGWVSEELFREGIFKTIKMMGEEVEGASGPFSYDSLFRIRLLNSFWEMGLEGHYTAAKILTALSVLTFIGSVWLAVVRARQGETRLLRGITFILGVMIFVYAQLWIRSDDKFVLGRYLFVPYALCWSSLILAVMDWRRSRTAGTAGIRDLGLRRFPLRRTH